jgi:hypothetical protein
VGRRLSLQWDRAQSYAARRSDRARRDPDAAVRRAEQRRADLLIPVVKAWSTDTGVEVASTGVQIHGGMGFIEETGAAQHYRDARIAPIYEGTNGIQAMDLVGRKLDLAGGEAVRRLLAELRADLETAAPELRPSLAAAQEALEAATRHLQTAGPDARGGGAMAYLRLFGHTLGGFLLARGAKAATGEEGRDWPGLARFYVRHLLPPAVGLLPVVTAGAEDLDPALLAA